MAEETIDLNEFFIPDDDERVDVDEDDLKSIGDFDELYKEVNELESKLKDNIEVPIQPYESMKEPCVEDFIRQFLAARKMEGTILEFEKELYDMQRRGEYNPIENTAIPSIYTENQSLHNQLSELTVKLHHMVQAANRARLHFDRFQKQRDFHRMHHRRVVQEKQKLISDLRRLKVHYEQFEPALNQLRMKYEGAMKEQLLAKLERERLLARLSALTKQLAEQNGRSTDYLNAQTSLNRDAGHTSRFSSVGGSILKSGTHKKSNSSTGNNITPSILSAPKSSLTSQKQSPWPTVSASNPNLTESYPQTICSNFKLAKSFDVHESPISRIAIHPKLNVVATASDDASWSTWTLPNGDLLMSGEGHKDFVSAVSFHPRGSILATGGGDGVMRLWDLVESKWQTNDDHSGSTIWDLAFHHSGDFIVSASQDSTAKVIDVHTLQTRHALRGHVDAVNSVCFQPFSNMILTGSADKTASLWDMRSGLCVQTFYGHNNAINSARFSLQGTQFASCDADGIVKLFDVRYVKETYHIDAGRHAANAVSFDRSGKTLAIASGDATIKIVDLEKGGNFMTSLEGHGDAVQDVCFDPQNSKFLVSCSADGTFKLWQ